jgi:hypothetical protein
MPKEAWAMLICMDRNGLRAMTGERFCSYYQEKLFNGYTCQGTTKYGTGRK